MGSYKEAVNELYCEKEKLLIIGLTGRTGAGCSTVAKILSSNFEELDFEYKQRDEFTEADKYKFEIVKEYISSNNRWIPFDIIQGSCVILSFVFEKAGIEGERSKTLINYLTEIQMDHSGIIFRIDNFGRLMQDLKGLDYIYEEVQKYPLSDITEPWEKYSNEIVEKYYQLYIHDITKYKERIKKILLSYSCYEETKKKIQDEPPVQYHLYTYLLQKFGNNIRASGNPFESIFNQKEYFTLAGRFSCLIDLIIHYNKLNHKDKTRICIDAIRNENESNYLKDKYRPYYLISISVEESVRISRLANLDINERTSLDNVEYSSKLKPYEVFYHQNISNCFEAADIHLLNSNEDNEKYFFITWQLVKYITLMIHPGLIAPTHLERCMQLAYTAKFNSGCLSRQVGAVVTGEDFAIKSIGWNDVPKGQLSCGLRTVDTYCRGNHKECFSEYEYTNSDFKAAMDKINDEIDDSLLGGRKFSFCFKDVYNGYMGERNQVYTRSLHAEENAFLQISKYGGQGVKGGYLFCTASPCELCSKKAYQLGIKSIYYIDPYPGISQKHILNFGENKGNPQMNLYYGAIGEAYISLFKPLLPYKDELELVSGVKCKEIAKKDYNMNKKVPDVMDLFYHSIEFTIEFKTREIIESIRNVNMEIKKNKYDKFDRKLTWTGSSYDGSELINNGNGYTLLDSTDKISPYRYQIQLNELKGPQDMLEYTIRSNLKDETHLMHPYIAHMIKNPTKQLVLKVIIPKGAPLIENVCYKRYADFNMEYEYTDNMELSKDELEDKIIYSLEVSNPNLFYTYSIEWEFIKIRT